MNRTLWGEPGGFRPLPRAAYCAGLFPTATAVDASLLGEQVLPQLQQRGLRGLLQDFASPKRLFRYALFTRGVHAELVEKVRA